MSVFQTLVLNHYIFSLAHKIQHTNNMGGCCWGWIVLGSLKQYLSNMPYFVHFLPCLIPFLNTLLLSLISLSPPRFQFPYHGGIFITTNVNFYPLYLSLAFSTSLLLQLILFPFPHSPVLLLCFFFLMWSLGFFRIAYSTQGEMFREARATYHFLYHWRNSFSPTPQLLLSTVEV